VHDAATSLREDISGQRSFGTEYPAAGGELEHARRSL